MKRLWILAATIPARREQFALAAGSVETATSIGLAQACHGANGNSTDPEWPSLAASARLTLPEQLKIQGRQTHQWLQPNAGRLEPGRHGDLWLSTVDQHRLKRHPSYGRREKLYRGRIQARAIPHAWPVMARRSRQRPREISGPARAKQSVYVMKQLNDYASGPARRGRTASCKTIAQRLSPTTCASGIVLTRSTLDHAPSDSWPCRRMALRADRGGKQQSDQRPRRCLTSAPTAATSRRSSRKR